MVNKEQETKSLLAASEYQPPTGTSEIQPADYSSSAISSVKRRWWQSEFKLMLLTFALLGVAAVLLIGAIPEPVVSIQKPAIKQDTVTKSGTEIELAPFDQAQREQARLDAQDVLSELLTSKKELEQKSVTDWALEQFNDALSKASEGDQAYKTSRYPEAIEKYQAAVDAMEGIFEDIPGVLQRRVAEGNSAIKQGKADLAKQVFNSALLLDRNHIPALQGLDRVATLDEVLDLIELAQQNEQRFEQSDLLEDIEAAVANYKAVETLDSLYVGLSTHLERVVQRVNDKHYRTAMSAGYKALFASRFSQARSAFNQALVHKPEDETATNVLRQALASDQRSSLTSLLAGASVFEKNEQWNLAVNNYQAVLQRDKNQVTARIGLIRAKARMELDTELRRVMVDPLAMAKPAARNKAESALAEANKIKTKGAILKNQISTISNHLDKMESTFRVSIASDNLTDISLAKAGAKKIKLGRFSEKKLALTPGRYVLIGTRLGYRDERTELEVDFSSDGTTSITVACSQPVTG